MAQYNYITCMVCACISRDLVTIDIDFILPQTIN